MANAVGDRWRCVVDDLCHQFGWQECIQNNFALLTQGLDERLKCINAHFEGCQAVDIINLGEYLVHQLVLDVELCVTGIDQ